VLDFGLACHSAKYSGDHARSFSSAAATARCD
jgi:hypothetical protein